jgi:hypothetical protein
MKPSMPSNTRQVATLALVAMFTLVTPCRAGSTDQETQIAVDRARARALLQQGISAIDAGSFEDARQTLLEAWRLQRSYDVAGALGQAELELGRYRDAAEHLDYSTRDFPPSERRELRAKVQDALTSARKQVASLRITAAPAGAEILVDGASVGRTPLEGPIFVDPGTHRVDAQLATYASNTSTVQAVAGSDQEVQLTLTKTKPETGPTADTSGDVGSRDTGARSSYAPALIAGGIGVATAAVGVGLLIGAGSKGSERDDRLASLPGQNPCAPGTPYGAECDAIRNLDDDARTFRTVAYISFGVTAAAGVATFLLWPRQRHSNTALVVLPIIGDREVAISAHARF